MEKKIRNYNIRVFGKVQGVSYRASASSIANELNIKGEIKNENDGSVYIEAEGDQEHLNHFLEWLKKGPPHAEVERIETSEDRLKGFSTFKIIKN